MSAPEDANKTPDDSAADANISETVTKIANGNQQLPPQSDEVSAQSDEIQPPENAVLPPAETETEPAVPDETESTSTDPPLRDFSRKNQKRETMRKASNLHCPFVWQADLHIKTYGDHDIDLLADADVMFEDTGFKFRR